ncbi:nuclear transport factor 2 family protein [Mesorhizobium sp. IMUNJ 23232]|uniref:nuclear transport factor 2 family protein n=1 Tax=Mesorhizobium sp. IMUNJ 23232 TaxID=3376064 RepID=UPI0037A502CD
MTVELPSALESYFAAKNRKDIDAMLSPFVADAVVRDEGHEHHGREAIRAWMEETTRKYGVSVEVREAERSGDRIVVKGLISGDFPGSPATLTYRFRLHDTMVASLEIG